MQSSCTEAQILPNITSNTLAVSSFYYIEDIFTTYPGRSTSKSDTVWSSIDSVIPVIAALVLLAIPLIPSF